MLEKIQIKHNNKQIGKYKEVLVENKLKNQDKYFGRTKDLTPVIFNLANDTDIGNLINVRIDGCNQNSLFGKKQIRESEVAA